MNAETKKALARIAKVCKYMREEMSADLAAYSNGRRDCASNVLHEIRAIRRASPKPKGRAKRGKGRMV